MMELYALRLWNNHWVPVKDLSLLGASFTPEHLCFNQLAVLRQLKLQHLSPHPVCVCVCVCVCVGVPLRSVGSV